MEREFHTVRGYQILNAEEKILTSSMEDYLEMIYRICREEGYIRINQLAEKLNVRPSSTTKVVQRLAACGMIDYQRYGIIRLTERGRDVGGFLLKRHEIIETFFRKLGIRDTLKDTEMIEHDISLNALQSIYSLNQFLAQNPDVLRQYQAYKKESLGNGEFQYLP
jgi:DtxR family Mn-dependent transcriptional regulator